MEGGGGGGGGGFWLHNPDSKVYGTNMGPTWGRQDLGGPHVGPMNFAICECSLGSHCGLLQLRLSGIKS